MTYLIDANIISYLLRGVPSVSDHIRRVTAAGDAIQIPVVAYYEVRRGLLANKATQKLAVFQNYLNDFALAQMSKTTYDIAAQIYADLRCDGQIIEDDDIFIGATALERDAVLVTNNPRHLARIAGLKIENWK